MAVTDAWADWSSTAASNTPAGSATPEIDDELRNVKAQVKGNVVGLAGNQTVAGVKTFSSFPVTPSSSPTTDYQVANKQYVDSSRLKARARCTTAQSIPADTITLVTIDTDTFDPANITDLTNRRITPTLAGYYQVNGQVAVNNLPNTAYLVGYIYKTGSEAAIGAISVNSSGTTARVASSVSDVVYLNGSTDYVDLRIYVSIGASLQASGGQNFISVVGPF